MTETIDAVMQFTENHDDQREADRRLVRALSDSDRLRTAPHDARDESSAPRQSGATGRSCCRSDRARRRRCGGRRRAMRHRDSRGPHPHIGKIYELTGPSFDTLVQIAEQYSSALGRNISYVDVPVEP